MSQSNQPELFATEPTTDDGPVTVLGQTFANDAERRIHFTELLRQKLGDPAFRAIEGFPIGTDEAILELSDPPYYTACPNPWLAEFIAEWETDKEALQAQGLRSGEPYHREPFAADVSEGKNDPIYNAHSYHTKVPHKAIMRYILHYTEPGDIVFDGFCGTGMTGVAAQLCGDRQEVESLGYRVDDDGTIYDGDTPFSRLGARKAVLNDLSPAATFIAYNYNTPVDVAAFEREAKRILKEVEAELGWMYETKHTDGRTGKINYTVWSDVFVCPQCAGEVIFWEAAVDKKAGKVRKEFSCPYCGATLTKREMDRAWVTRYDRAINETIRQAKQVPVLINYSVGKKRFEKEPDVADLALIERIETSEIPYWFPTDRMMEGREARRNDSVGMTNIHHYYTKRNLFALAATLDRLRKGNPRHSAWFTSTMSWVGRELRLHLGNYFGGGGGSLTSLRGTLYVASLSAETNVFERLALRIRWQSFRNRLKDSLTTTETCDTSVGSLQPNSCDYVFIDPPFGANLSYSELNNTLEGWLGVKTNYATEAVENASHGKRLEQYRELIATSFERVFYSLKPGRWATVEFSNTNAVVWNVIQTALAEAGFIVADVSGLDKKKGSFKAVTTTTAVKQDLVISAYKPNGGFTERFEREATTEAGVWDFIRTHLNYLPVTKQQDGALQRVPERDPRLLYDQLVAYYVRHGYPVPLGSHEFQQGLAQRFSERDGMVFLPEQTPDYDAARVRAGQIAQMALFVSDEKSSIQWLRQQLDPALGGRPQTYQEIQPLFLRNLHQASHEVLPELRDLLQDNFLQDENGRWYAPDPNKAGDLEKLRQRALLAEFESYLTGSGRLKQFRSEAVRAGFADAYQRKAFDRILTVAGRLKDSVIQEDPDLLMYYDAASLRA